VDDPSLRVEARVPSGDGDSCFQVATITFPPEGCWRIVGPGEPNAAKVVDMSESLHVTIVYEEGEDGWIVASIPEVPGAHSQGHTREEARANVIDALRGILELRFGEHAGVAEAADSEPLELVIGA
jgi:predicted RNase H-like HicB family nuclease